MTNRQMDKLIRTGQPVKFINTHFKEEFTATPIAREGRTVRVRAADGYEAIIHVDELAVESE
jgi:hypothetical protein